MSAKVLYVDDEVDLLDLAKTFFEDEGIELDICSDIHTALTKIKAGHYSVIISDAKMPSGSGHELFRILRSEVNFTGKLYLVTGHLEKDSESAKDYDFVIYKPIKFFELIDEIKTHL